MMELQQALLILHTACIGVEGHLSVGTHCVEVSISQLALFLATQVVASWNGGLNVIIPVFASFHSWLSNCLCAGDGPACGIFRSKVRPA